MIHVQDTIIAPHFPAVVATWQGIDLNLLLMTTMCAFIAVGVLWLLPGELERESAKAQRWPKIAITRWRWIASWFAMVAIFTGIGFSIRTWHLDRFPGLPVFSLIEIAVMMSGLAMFFQALLMGLLFHLERKTWFHLSLRRWYGITFQEKEPDLQPPSGGQDSNPERGRPSPDDASNQSS